MRCRETRDYGGVICDMHLGGLIRRVCHSQWIANELYILVLVLLLPLPQSGQTETPPCPLCAILCGGTFALLWRTRKRHEMAAREFKITLGRFAPRAGADQCCHDEYGSRVDRRLSSYGVQSVEGGKRKKEERKNSSTYPVYCAANVSPSSKGIPRGPCL